MQLDRLEAVLRRRGAHEAIDLGFALARRHAGALARAWAVAVLPAWALIGLATSSEPIWGIILITLLDPLWERVVLHVLSRALFGAPPRGRELLRALPRLWTAGVLPELLWGRLRVNRAMVAPVAQLEGLRGAPARRRRDVLARGPEAGAGVGLSIFAAAMQLGLSAGALGLVFLMLPEAPRFEVGVLFEGWFAGTAPAWFAPLPWLAWLAARSVTLPLRVAGGFGLYLNRRTLIEGWDVELTFRRIAARAARGALPGAAVILGLILMGTSPMAFAEDPGHGGLPAVEAEVARALARPELGGEQVEGRWERRAWLQALLDREPEPAPASAPLDLGWVATLIEIAAWVGLATILVGAVIALVRQGLPRLRARGPRPPPRAGLLPAPAGPALPDDPAAAAWALWRAGQPAEALGVLYATAVVSLVEVHRVQIPAGATEGEVLRAARAAALPEPQSAWLRRLTRAWGAAAYAHRAPEEDELRAICDGLPAFRRAGGAA